MHSEAEIRRAIKPLLDKYGQLTTSEVKQKLNEVLNFDDEDKEPSDSRNEIKIIQRIGNIVSHQTVTKKIYDEGFELDKSGAEATFTAVDGIANINLSAISKTEIKNRKRRSKKFVGRDVDWANKYEENKEIGNMGEEFVCQYERDRVSEFSPSDVDRVQHLSKLQGDGLGYDISSIDNNGNILRIEVKTSSGPANGVFYMSRNEKKFFEEYENDGAVIYRVYNFDKSTRRGLIKIITATDLLNNYYFDPITFAVKEKWFIIIKNHSQILSHTNKNKGQRF